MSSEIIIDVIFKREFEILASVSFQLAKKGMKNKVTYQCLIFQSK